MKKHQPKQRPNQKHRHRVRAKATAKRKNREYIKEAANRINLIKEQISKNEVSIRDYNAKGLHLEDQGETKEADKLKTQARNYEEMNNGLRDTIKQISSLIKNKKKSVGLGVG